MPAFPFLKYETHAKIHKYEIAIKKLIDRIEEKHFHLGYEVNYQLNLEFITIIILD